MKSFIRHPLIIVPLAGIVVIAGLLVVFLNVYHLPASWKVYHDQTNGYSLHFPQSWEMTTEQDGSHPTLLDTQTSGALSPLITTVSQSVHDALQTAIPGDAIQVKWHSIGGHEAVEYVVPAATSVQSFDHDGLSDTIQTHEVVIGAANIAGTTNLYTLQLSQPVRNEHLSAAQQAEGSTFMNIADSFSLPSTVLPIEDAVNTTQAAHCDSVCWADANWNYDDELDANNSLAYDCDSSGYNWTPTGYKCIGVTYHEVKAPAHRFQPNFQCGDYVARALTQQGLLPGLKNGGVDGSSVAAGVTGVNTANSYGSYPSTRAPYSRTTFYPLTWAGTYDAATKTGLQGMYDYFTNLGIAVNIGQNLGAAQPGDIVFMYSGAITPENRSHVMIITSIVQNPNGINGLDALVDSHNYSRYHLPLSGVITPTYTFDILHFRGTRTGYPATLNTSGHMPFYSGKDLTGQPYIYAKTSTSAGSYWTSWAGVYATSAKSGGFTTDCATLAYIPATTKATATATFQVETSDKLWHRPVIKESNPNLYGWVVLYAWGQLNHPPIAFKVSNFDGTSTHYLGIGSQVYFIC